MPIKKHITALVLALVLHQAAVAWPEEGEPFTATLTPVPRQEEQQPPQQPSEPIPFFENFQLFPLVPIYPTTTDQLTGFVDRLHGELSDKLLTTATWLDSFFADERAAAEQNQSYARARYDVFKERRTSPTYAPTVDLRAALPQLEKKAHIVISAEPADTSTSKNAPVAAATAGERTGPPEERNITTALYYFLRSTVKESIIVRTGAQFSHGSPVLFISPRYRWFTPVDSWDFRFTQDVIWRTDTGWQADTRFDIERQLPHALFFRTSLGGTWLDDKDGYFYSGGCSLRQPFDQTHALEYEWLSSFQTRPVNELMEVMFRVRYRQRFWRDWMFFELAPQYRLPRDNNFHGVPGVLFRFEMFFGRKP